MVEDKVLETKEERKQLIKDGWVSSVKLSRVPEIGWTINWLAASIKAGGKGPYFGPEEVLRAHPHYGGYISPGCGRKYYYREKEIIPAMKAFAAYCQDNNIDAVDVNVVRKFWVAYKKEKNNEL